MKNLYILSLFFMIFNFTFAQIVNIPDANFKNTLVNQNCVDTNGDGFADSDADINNDGEIQQSEAEAIVWLDVSYKGIHSLEGIQSFVNVEYLNCEYNQLSDLDLSQNTDIVWLNCYYNNIESLNISQSPNLIDLDCAINALTTLDVTQNTKLERLQFAYNQITSIDVSENPKIRVFSATDNQLTTLDVTQIPNLEQLYCGSNLLTNLDLLNPNLEVLYALNNQFNSLNVSQCPNLVTLSLVHNNLVSLNVSNNFNLEVLDCRDNQITSLDVSNLSSLEKLLCSENILTSLNIKNGNNANLTNLNAIDNPSLFCVEVDDEVYANSQICDTDSLLNDWCIDPWADYSKSCELSVENNAKNRIALYPNPTDGILNIEYDSNLGIGFLQVFNVMGKLVLSKSNNFQSIDVSILGSGLYLLKIKTKERLLFKRIVIN